MSIYVKSISIILTFTKNFRNQQERENQFTNANFLTFINLDLDKKPFQYEIDYNGTVQQRSRQQQSHFINILQVVKFKSLQKFVKFWKNKLSYSAFPPWGNSDNEKFRTNLLLLPLSSPEPLPYSYTPLQYQYCIPLPKLSTMPFPGPTEKGSQITTLTFIAKPQNFKIEIYRFDDSKLIVKFCEAALQGPTEISKHLLNKEIKWSFNLPIPHIYRSNTNS